MGLPFGLEELVARRQDALLDHVLLTSRRTSGWGMSRVIERAGRLYPHHLPDGASMKNLPRRAWGAGRKTALLTEALLLLVPMRESGERC